MSLERKLLTALSLVSVLALTVSCPCLNCPDCPDCPAEPVSKLVIEDAHSAVWMPFDNDFVSNPGTTPVCDGADVNTDAGRKSAFGQCASYSPSTQSRAGVLIQIGKVIKPPGERDHFKHVVLTLADGTSKTLVEADFDWLDVNGLTDCAIDALQAYSLFENAVVHVDCDDATLVVPPSPAEPFPDTCLRKRRLHASHRPIVGAITYWPGANYYTLRAEASTHGHGHVLNTFGLLDPVSVNRWKDGCFMERYDNVKEIRVAYIAPSSDHSTYPHSPIDGGNSTPR